MSLDDLLSHLKRVNGYRAAGVMDSSGELVISDTKDSSVDLALVGASFNDIFREANDACERIGFVRNTDIALKTPHGMVLMKRIERASGEPVHLISVVGADGNHALMKMMMVKAAPAVASALS